MNAKSQTTEWLSIESAPRDGTPVWLFFREGHGNIRGNQPIRMKLPERETVATWWSAERVFQRIGKRSRDGMRGARIARDGGFWGLVKKSVPLSGMPIAWRPLSDADRAERGMQ